MLRQMALVCAAGVLMTAAACSFKLGNNLLQVDVKPNEQVVNSTIDRAAARRASTRSSAVSSSAAARWSPT